MGLLYFLLTYTHIKFNFFVSACVERTLSIVIFNTGCDKPLPIFLCRSFLNAFFLVLLLPLSMLRKEGQLRAYISFAPTLPNNSSTGESHQKLLFPACIHVISPCAILLDTYTICLLGRGLSSTYKRVNNEIIIKFFKDVFRFCSNKFIIYFK